VDLCLLTRPGTGTATQNVRHLATGGPFNTACRRLAVPCAAALLPAAVFSTTCRSPHLAGRRWARAGRTRAWVKLSASTSPSHQLPPAGCAGGPASPLAALAAGGASSGTAALGAAGGEKLGMGGGGGGGGGAGAGAAGALAGAGAKLSAGAGGGESLAPGGCRHSAAPVRPLCRTCLMAYATMWPTSHYRHTSNGGAC